MSLKRYLTGWTPRTGRHIAEDGSVVNLADLAQRADQVDFLLAVEDGLIYQAAWRGAIPGNSTIRFAQPVQSDSIRGIVFSGVIKGGPIEYTLCVGATFGDALETIDGYNADRRLFGNAGFISDNPVFRVDSATGGTIIDRGYGQTPSTGASRASAGLSAAGVGGIYGGGAEPCFTLQNTGSSVAQVALTWIWKERPE